MNNKLFLGMALALVMLSSVAYAASPNFYTTFGRDSNPSVTCSDYLFSAGIMNDGSVCPGLEDNTKIVDIAGTGAGGAVTRTTRQLDIVPTAGNWYGVRSNIGLPPGTEYWGAPVDFG